ncbi:MAG: NADPH:quinone oxidoreductase family protein, partial [Alphaproteobacteria bacterium]
MRAVIVNEFGPVDSHSLEELASPVPGPGEVLIDVHAIGVNFPDTLMVQGMYQTKPERPFTPGRDVAGFVAAIGEGVSQVKPGDRVSALVTIGAYAEQCIAPESRCFSLPDEVDFVTAAGMTTVYLTAWVALMARGRYQPGDKVLVLGASGGVGLSAVQIAKAKGAFVIGGDITEEKRAVVSAAGADAVIDLSGDDLKETLRAQVFAVTDGYGVDVVIDPVGGVVFESALRALAFDGRIVAVGFVAGIPSTRANYFNVKNLTLAGLALDLHFRHKPEVIQEAAADLF